MAALLPMLAMGIPAVLSGISGIMGIANEAKKLHGGRIGRLRRRRGGKLGHVVHAKKTVVRPMKAQKVGTRRYVVRNRANKPTTHKKTYYASSRIHKGKGAAADVISRIPLLGSILGPIVSAFGGKLKLSKLHKMVKHMPAKQRRFVLRKLAGKGLSPMYIQRPYVGRGLSPMYIQRPYVGRGMLTPPGGHYLALIKSLANNIPTNNRPSITRVNSRPKQTISIPHKNIGYPGTSYKNIEYPGTSYKNIEYPGTSYKIPQHKNMEYPGTPFDGGLLSPAGGAIYRKGHLRKIPGKKQRIRVKPSLVRKRGGYMPYTF